MLRRWITVAVSLAMTGTVAQQLCTVQYHCIVQFPEISRRKHRNKVTKSVEKVAQKWHALFLGTKT